MKYIDSGSGKMPLITLLAVLSVSLTINLPGLAVSPILSKLHHTFHSTELESQMLTSLPNLCMIPVVLIAGRLATPRRQTGVLACGLLLFLCSGVCCLFADNIVQLIVLGCLVGVGCGMVVPIAAGAISEWFVGRSRQEDLGWKSTTSNAMVILANLYAGWVAVYSWHAAFAVYLMPVIPLALLPFMTQRFVAKYRKQKSAASVKVQTPPALHFKGRASWLMLVRLIVLYAVLTYATTSISYYSPFLMDAYGMGTGAVGVVTAMYYLMCAVSGAFVGSLKRFFGRPVMFISLAFCAAGLLVIGLTRSYGLFIGASLLTGFGYGIIQPILYNKTTYVAPTRKAGTQFFGYVLSANYLGITLVPYVDSFMRKLFGATAPGFEFVFSGTVVLALLVWALLDRRNYVFEVNPDSAAPSAQAIAS